VGRTWEESGKKIERKWEEYGNEMGKVWKQRRIYSRRNLNEGGFVVAIAHGRVDISKLTLERE
jgi:hypothetical protein